MRLPSAVALAVLLGWAAHGFAQDPTPVLPPPTVIPAPPPTLIRVPTLWEFATSFKPMPGSYEVVVMHPFTNCPVKVCFALPPGCVARVQVHHRRRLAIDYGKSEINVVFDRKGGVQVKYS